MKCVNWFPTTGDEINSGITKTQRFNASVFEPVIGRLLKSVQFCLSLTEIFSYQPKLQGEGIFNKKAILKQSNFICGTILYTVKTNHFCKREWGKHLSNLHLDWSFTDESSACLLYHMITVYDLQYHCH